MGGGFGGEWIHVYVWLSSFLVHLKLPQHCLSAISQYKIKSLEKNFLNYKVHSNIKKHTSFLSKIFLLYHMTKYFCYAWKGLYFPPTMVILFIIISSLGTHLTDRFGEQILLRHAACVYICCSVMSDCLWPMDCSWPGSSVCRILQARILEEVAIPFSRGSSRPRDRTQVSCFAGGFFTIWATREAPGTLFAFC